MRSVGTSRQDCTQGSLVCDWCGQVTPANYVHGHIQCIHCHRNIAPCCDGEVCTPGPAGNAKGA